MNRLAIVALLSAVNAFGQFDTAVILGTVRDAKGGAVSATAVTALNKQTGIQAIGKTGNDGNYLFPSLRIGNYKITAARDGFANAIADDVNLTVNARQRVDLTLQVNTVTETVNVTAITPLLETDNSSKGQVIQARQIVSFPVLGRTYSSFALLSPGVRESNSSNSGSVAFRREGAYNVNGLRSVFNNFVLDGVDNNFYGTTNQGFSNQAVQPSPDSVAEIPHDGQRLLRRIRPHRRSGDERGIQVRNQ